jgi:hypothetical protein
MGALEVEHLNGSYVRGTWREGSFTGGPDIYIYGKTLEMGIFLYRGPTGEPGGEVCLLGTSRDS